MNFQSSIQFLEINKILSTWNHYQTFIIYLLCTKKLTSRYGILRIRDLSTIEKW
jgi:hypothetical protein